MLNFKKIEINFKSLLKLYNCLQPPAYNSTNIVNITFQRIVKLKKVLISDRILKPKTKYLCVT